MAKWNMNNNNGMTAAIEFDTHGSRSQVVQDINPFLEEAKSDRASGDGDGHYTKMFSVPEIIAIEINQKWGIDIFDPTFMHDTTMKAKFFTIIEQEYPHLRSSEKRFT